VAAIALRRRSESPRVERKISVSVAAETRALRARAMRVRVLWWASAWARWASSSMRLRSDQQSIQWIDCREGGREPKRAAARAACASAFAKATADKRPRRCRHRRPRVRTRR
jgi:hypothetical protein